MPKHNIMHQAGTSASDELKELLMRFFNEKDIRKLEKHGGRIQISLAAPFTPKKRKNSIEINHQFVSDLQSVKNDQGKIRDVLFQLTIKQLRELGKLIDVPLRTKSSRHGMIEEMIASLYSEEIWRRISNV